MATAAAAATLGISVELVLTACTALGIGVVGAVFTGQLMERIKEWIKTREIGRIDSHAKTKKHKFNDKCGDDCIMEVAKILQVRSSWLADNGVPIIRGSGFCKHGCEIEERLSIPPLEQEWVIKTCFHKGDCKAI